MAAPPSALDFAKPDLGLAQLRWPFVCLAGVVLLILFGDLLPAWAVAPPQAWTDNLPLPYLDFTAGFPPALESQCCFAQGSCRFGLYRICRGDHSILCSRGPGRYAAARLRGRRLSGAPPNHITLLVTTLLRGV